MYKNVIVIDYIANVIEFLHNNYFQFLNLIKFIFFLPCLLFNKSSD